MLMVEGNWKVEGDGKYVSLRNRRRRIKERRGIKKAREKESETKRWHEEEGRGIPKKKKRRIREDESEGRRWRRPITVVRVGRGGMEAEGGFILF